MENGNDEKAILDAFKQRLIYNALETKVVLYSSEKMYEYNYKNNMIRPFLSIIWFKTDDNDFVDFTKYMNFRIDEAVNELEDTGYTDDKIPNSIGYYTNGHIVVNISSIGNFIKNDYDFIKSHELDMKSIKESFEKFDKFLNRIYIKFK